MLGTSTPAEEALAPVMTIRTINKDDGDGEVAPEAIEVEQV